VNHATIARRLHSLEDSLGEKLVERHLEGFVLTLAGTHTLAVASDMDSASHTLGRAGPDFLIIAVVARSSARAATMAAEPIKNSGR
jgi:DNA-binding transcriptional LysR family regulator